MGAALAAIGTVLAVLTTASIWCSVRLKDAPGDRVRFSVSPFRPWKVRLRVRVGIDPAVRVRRESFFEKTGLSLEKWRITPGPDNAFALVNDLRLRDFGFDDRIDFRGPRPETIALMSHDVRQKVLQTIHRDRGRIRNGEITVHVWPFGTRYVSRKAATVVDLATALEARVALGVRACLHEIATADPWETVRAVGLANLHEKFPDAPEVLSASRLAARGEEIWYRNQGISLLPEDERKAVWTEILEDRKLLGSLRALGLRYLALRALQEEAEALCIRFLERQDVYLTVEAAKVLGEKAGTARCLERLLALRDWDMDVDAHGIGRVNIGRFAGEMATLVRARLDPNDAGQLALADPSVLGALSPAAEQGSVSMAKKTPAS